MNLRKWNSNSSELMKRIQIVDSSLQGISIELPSTSAISEEEETYPKLTTNPQDCKEGSLFQNYLVFFGTLSSYLILLNSLSIHTAFQPTADHF